MLERIGPRRWIAIILAAWGALSAAGALVQGPTSFYVVRFLLGVAEAGFFPGMILYMSYWFPRAYRARLIATFMIAVPVSRIVGGPLSSIILQMDGVADLDGWRWLFLIEGTPACLLALLVLKFLPDGPAHAAWLTRDEKALIAARLAAEEAPVQRDVWPALLDPRVLALGLVIFGTSLGSDGLSLWLPLIVQGMGVSNFANGFVVAIPSIAGACANRLFSPALIPRLPRLNWLSPVHRWCNPKRNRRRQPSDAAYAGRTSLRQTTRLPHVTCTISLADENDLFRAQSPARHQVECRTTQYSKNKLFLIQNNCFLGSSAV